MIAMLPCIAKSQTQPPLKIMPLGDSITAGYGSDATGGYRLPLQQKLAAAGIAYQFVGTQATHNPTPAPAQPNHEGHDGWTMSQIDGIVKGVGSVVTQYNPDVIFLMIGTNDLIPNSLDGTAISVVYKGLLDDIFAAKPSVTVLVSPVIYNRVADPIRTDDFNIGGRIFGGPNGQTVIGYSSGGLDSLVASYASAGKHITFVSDMRTTMGVSDLSDGIHPTAAGYNKMAGVWASAIPATVPEPGTLLTAVGAGGLLLRRPATTRNTK